MGSNDINNQESAAIELGYAKLNAKIYVGENSLLLIFPEGSSKMVQISRSLAKQIYQQSKESETLRLFHERKQDNPHS